MCGTATYAVYLSGVNDLESYICAGRTFVGGGDVWEVAMNSRLRQGAVIGALPRYSSIFDR
jgi:hypothetical protein